ncbi:hypothetical protein BH09MYX1_BH09MYX1_38740 [soil metagenome]
MGAATDGASEVRAVIAWMLASPSDTFRAVSRDARPEYLNVNVGASGKLAPMSFYVVRTLFL